MIGWSIGRRWPISLLLVHFFPADNWLCHQPLIAFCAFWIVLCLVPAQIQWLQWRLYGGRPLAAVDGALRLQPTVTTLSWKLLDFGLVTP